MDCILGLPETRRIVKKSSARIRGIVYKEEEKQQRLTAEILSSLKGTSSEVPL